MNHYVNTCDKGYCGSPCQKENCHLCYPGRNQQPMQIQSAAHTIDLGVRLATVQLRLQEARSELEYARERAEKAEAELKRLRELVGEIRIEYQPVDFWRDVSVYDECPDQIRHALFGALDLIERQQVELVALRERLKIAERIVAVTFEGARMNPEDNDLYNAWKSSRGRGP